MSEEEEQQHEEEEQWSQPPSADGIECEKPTVSRKRYKQLMLDLSAKRREVAKADSISASVAKRFQRTRKREAPDIYSDMPQGEIEEAPIWARQAHPSHSLLCCGGVLACTKCALQATSMRPRLAQECRGEFPKGSDRDLERLRKAELPKSLRTWPEPNKATKVRKLV